jgi:MFS family permease
MNVKFTNVLVLGFGFMFLFTAFQTMGNIEQTILKSISRDDPSFEGNAYVSLAIIYAVFSLCNWIAPPIISLTGPRGAMLLGAVTYCLFMVSFLWPHDWLLYTVSAVLGFGAAIIWTGQGTYLSRCSDESTISRNSGIFWAMLQMSMFIGNLFVFFQFQGKTHIDQETRTLVFTVLIAIGILGFIFLAGLRRVDSEEVVHADDPEPDEDVPSGSSNNMMAAFKSSIQLFFTKDMILLSIAFFYTGLELSFFSGVYSPSIGFTSAFNDLAKPLVGLSGIFIGVGEVFGGVLFGLLGSKTKKLGRNPIVVMGFIIHFVSFVLIFLNLPNASPLGETSDVAFFNPPIPSVALTCSFLLGFGDSCFNTQIYSMLGGVFAKKSTEAFSIFKFTQSIAAAISFAYSSYLGLRIQMIILVVLGVVGTASFYIVECAQRRKQAEESQEKSKLDTTVVPS